jgi:oxygen-independent coproporphyrinogen-3 oxidase
LPERYLARVRSGEPPEAGRETPDADTRARERLGLALRTRAGVHVDADVADGEAIHELEGLGLLTYRNGTAVLTPRGRLLASEVTLRLMGRNAETRIGTRYDGLPIPHPALRQAHP